MSLEAITWAMGKPVPNSSAKFVLVAMANRANPDNLGRMVAYPSIEYLVAVTSQNRKTIISNLAKLREANLIQDTGDRVGRTGQVIVDEMVMPPDLFEESRNRNRSKNGTGPKKAVKSPTFSVQRSQKRDPDSKGFVSIPKSGEVTAKKPKSRAEGEAMATIANLLGKPAPAMETEQ